MEARVREPRYDCYVVRIYSRDRGNPQRMHGVVELVGSGAVRSFGSVRTLLKWLRAVSVPAADEDPREPRAARARRGRIPR